MIKFEKMHKWIETSRRGEWYNEVEQKPIQPPPRKEMSHAYSVKQSEEICKTLNALRLGNFLSDVYLEHVKTLTRSVFMLGYKGKVVNAEVFSEKHRTTVAHFWITEDGTACILKKRWNDKSLIAFTRDPGRAERQFSAL